MIVWRCNEPSLRLLTPNYTEVFKIAHAIKDFGFVAGGAALSIHLGSKIGDIDIYLREKDNISTACVISILVEVCDVVTYLSTSRFAESHICELGGQTYTVQIILPQEPLGLTTYGTPEEVVSSFDFNVCQMYIEDGEVKKARCARSVTWGSYVRVMNVTNPAAVMARLHKYIQKGFRVPQSEFAKVFKVFGDLDDQDHFLSVMGADGFENYGAMDLDRTYIRGKYTRVNQPTTPKQASGI